MLEAIISGKVQGSTPGAALKGIYEAQPIIASGDFNFYQCGWCIVDKYLYIAPGYIKGGSNYVASNTFYRIDMDTLVITTLATIPRYCYKPQLIHNNGRIYLVAGIPLSPSTTSPLCYYDLGTKTWTNTGKADNQVYSTRAEVIDGFLYTFGGILKSGGLSYSIIKVNLTDFSTSLVGTNPLQGKYVNNEGKAVVYKGKIYFSRGLGGTTNNFMVFDPASGTLTDLANNPSSKGGESFVLWGDNIVARGGNTELYVYDFVTNTWSTITCAANASTVSSTTYPFFVYKDGIWFKQLDSDSTTARRFWKIY